MEPRQLCFTVKQAAAALQVSLPTLYAALEANEIPGARKVGAQWRIGVSALMRWFSGYAETHPGSQTTQTWP